MKIVLASTSPRRQELMKQITNEFIICPPQYEEKIDQSLSPEKLVCKLAEGKCDSVFLLHPDKIIIACDTIVVYNDTILGKPKNSNEAIKTLHMLSGQKHFVFSGICIRKEGKKAIQYDKTIVQINNLSDEFIKQYVANGSPLDKAGSYGIQDNDIVEKYFGDYNSALGLPVTLIKEILNSF